MKLRKLLADGLAFMTWNGGIGIVVSLVAGLTWRQIIFLGIFWTIFNFVQGVPFGFYQDKIRKAFRC